MNSIASAPGAAVPALSSLAAWHAVQPGDGESPFLAVQVEAERLAIDLLGRADVLAAIESLTATWREGTPGQWPETYALLPASIREVAFMVALEVINDDPRRPRVVEISAAPHRWGGLDVPGGRWGINNPDTLYFAVPIEIGASYVIRGRRSADGPIDTNFSVQIEDVWATLGNLGQRDLAIDADGTYRVTVDDQAAQGRRNHVQIKEGGTVLILRQTLADWSKARPDAITVERTGGPAPEPLRSDDELARQIITRLAAVVTHNLNTLQAPIFRLPANTILQPGAPGDKSGYLVTQRSTLGHFRLEDDEALVAVFSPGGAGYAAFTVTNVWGVTPDSARHQNSLNNHQAVLDADGNMTLVISNRDPGIHNWIDPAGLREGIYMLRWQLLDEHPNAGRGPGIELKLVRSDELDSVLPPGVPRVDASERRRQIKARGASNARRFAQR